MDLVLCGIDVATISGLTVLENGVYTTTTYRGSVKKKAVLQGEKELFLDGDREGEIGRKWEDYLHAYLKKNRVKHVAIEAPVPSNKTRTKEVVNIGAEWAGNSIKREEVKGTSLASIYRIYGMSFVAVSVCSRLNIEVHYVAQQTWRMHFLGHGRPKDAKDESVKMCAKMGIPVSSKDAAESAGIVFWLNRSLNPNAPRGDDLFDQTKTAAQMQARQNAEGLFKQ